jgi:FtsP/CotA-like multicopper oxidase with cupredoxin domain
MFAATTTKEASPVKRLLRVSVAALGSLLWGAAQAAAPGITGTTFNLTAQPAYVNQPDGQAVYSWGYGCVSTTQSYLPAAIGGATCPTMQIPGPTLIVTQNQSITVNLTNNLPASAGNTSILFPGFTLTGVSGGVPGLLTREAAPNTTVSYTFTATTPGTHAYYSGTQGDLQVEMGLYGAIIVLPASVPGVCAAGLPATAPHNNAAAQAAWGEHDFRLAATTGSICSSSPRWTRTSTRRRWHR